MCTVFLEVVMPRLSGVAAPISVHPRCFQATRRIMDNRDNPPHLLSMQHISPGLSTQNLPPSLRLSDFKLIAFDMDSTLINIECIDEVAAAAGRKAEVAAITEAAMRGEITDFKESLRRRVAMLKGVPESALHEVLHDRLHPNPGAKALIDACKAAGLKVLLVSGGFTFFAEHVRSLLGIDYTRSNILEIENGHLTGGLVSQSWGEICDGAEKRRTLLEMASLLHIQPSQCIAMGDGANDLPMMGAAGLSVAYHAKPKVREQAMVSITEGGLDRLLEIFTK
jgi:phosphoserine phosphatase